MKTRLTKILFFCLFTIVTFFSFYKPIADNSIGFGTDELYWIQTARIIPYILDNKFHDPYWREHMGFTNFNGAKWMYAFGLAMFGHKDFSAIGNPPFHYELWKKYDGLPFPRNHELYLFLFHGRLISAFVASLAISCMFFFVYKTLNYNIVAALFASILLRMHPITVQIATHALGDSLLLF